MYIMVNDTDKFLEWLYRHRETVDRGYGYLAAEDLRDLVSKSGWGSEMDRDGFLFFFVERVRLGHWRLCQELDCIFVDLSE